VVKVLETFNEDEDSVQGGGRMVTPVMSGGSARVSAAVVGVAKRIEDNVRRVVTAAAA
jgi:hypothetical protein